MDKNPDADVRALLEEKYGDVATPEFEVDSNRLASGEPVAYVIGWQPFLGLKIFLDSHPLIPRTETEWWAEQLLKEIPTGGEIAVLDLCAGSGAVGCALLKNLPHAKVYFGEIDPAHEATIQKNIVENNLDVARADVRIGDLFAPFENLKFDVIAINPPYIPNGRELPESVSKFEPAVSLFSGEDGLALIRRIATKLHSHLKSGGQAWIECDVSNIDAAKTLFLAGDMQAQIRTDQFDAPRILVVSLPV